MNYVYVKDSEGFVAKKLESQLLPDELIITEEEYKELSGENYYKKHFGRGGKREGAGRKPSACAWTITKRVSEQEKNFINYIRSNNLNYDELMRK